jgi:hypothetical protein
MYSDVPHSVRALSRSPISLADRHKEKDKRGGDNEDIKEEEREEGKKEKYAVDYKGWRKERAGVEKGRSRGGGTGIRGRVELMPCGRIVIVAKSSTALCTVLCSHLIRSL